MCFIIRGVFILGGFRVLNIGGFRDSFILFSGYIFFIIAGGELKEGIYAVKEGACVAVKGGLAAVLFLIYLLTYSLAYFYIITKIIKLILNINNYNNIFIFIYFLL